MTFAGVDIVNYFKRIEEWDKRENSELVPYIVKVACFTKLFVKYEGESVHCVSICSEYMDNCMRVTNKNLLEWIETNLNGIINDMYDDSDRFWETIKAFDIINLREKIDLAEDLGRDDKARYLLEAKKCLIEYNKKKGFVLDSMCSADDRNIPGCDYNQMLGFFVYFMRNLKQ